MTTSWVQIMETVIERAKEAVEKASGDRYAGREWLDASLDSYQDAENRVRLLVIEGSPVKGYVVANYGTGIVQAYDAQDRRIAIYSAETMVVREEREAAGQQRSKMMI